MTRSYGKYVWLVCIGQFATLLPAQQPSLRPKTAEAVWTWSKQCDGSQQLAVTVRLDGKALYRNIISICRGDRSKEEGRIEFNFPGGHLFQKEYSTRSSESVEGNIWQAGGEKDALILGVSFATPKQVLLNTLHIARPDRRTSSELDNGLSITTSPVHAR